MSEVTRRDNAHGDFYIAILHTDPTVTPYKAPAGMIGILPGANPGVWQKQDNGSSTNWAPLSGGGGGGDINNLGVVTVDPPGAVDDNYWLLKADAVVLTSITADIHPQSLAIEMRMPIGQDANPTVQDLIDLGGGVQWDTINWDNGFEGGISVSNDAQGTVTLSYEDGVTTAQQAVDALNVYSQNLVGKDIAQLSGPDDDLSTLLDQEVNGSQPVVNNGQAASAKWRTRLGGVNTDVS